MRSLSSGACTYTIHRLAVSDETPIEVGESQEPLNLGDSLKYVIFPLLNRSDLGRVLGTPFRWWARGKTARCRHRYAPLAGC